MAEPPSREATQTPPEIELPRDAVRMKRVIRARRVARATCWYLREGTVVAYQMAETPTEESRFRTAGRACAAKATFQRSSSGAANVVVPATLTTRTDARVQRTADRQKEA
jgi:hypothetical protein